MPATALLLAASLATSAGQSAPTVDLAQLERRVVAFLGADVGEPGGPQVPIDRRLKLAACDGRPMLDWRTPRRDAVVITCPSGPRWRIFVPLRRVSVSAAASTVAAAPAAAATSVAPAPIVIKRGDPVSVIASSDGFRVTHAGIAAGDAAAGGRLQVRIDGSGKPVQTVAVEAGLASLPGW